MVAYMISYNIESYGNITLCNQGTHIGWIFLASMGIIYTTDVGTHNKKECFSLYITR